MHLDNRERVFSSHAPDSQRAISWYEQSGEKGCQTSVRFPTTHCENSILAFETVDCDLDQGLDLSVGQLQRHDLDLATFNVCGLLKFSNVSLYVKVCVVYEFE